jgi:signal transduction histidine kinase/DNA-binding response OmpR family regulator
VSSPPPKTRVRLLIIEDSADDLELELAELRRGGFQPDVEVVDDLGDVRAALTRRPWDAVIADFRLPSFSGLDALEVVRAIDPDLPFILVSGTVGEDFAIEAMRAGVSDYVLKENFARLSASLERELRDAAIRRAKRRLEEEQHFLAEAHRFLADAGRELVRTLDVQATMLEAARLGASWLAEHVVCYLVEDGQVRAVEQAHVEGDDDLPSAVGGAHPARAALAQNAPILIPEVTDEVLQSLGIDGEEARRRLDLRAILAVPLRGRSDPIGALLLASAGPGGRRYAQRELAVAEDFAGRVGLALENARLYRQTREAVRARDEFLAMLGHELRNPLAPILTAVELIKMRGDSPARREHQVIERQARHLVRLVDDLLDVSRVTRGKIALRRAAVELGAVVAKAIETASPLIEQRHHRLLVDVAAAGLLVFGDEARLVQVVSNLLTNAAKYTDPGGEIRVRARRAGGEIVLSVADTGAGIPADLLPVLFDAFVQGSRTMDRHAGGLGLGLAIARSLTALHGGSIEAYSEGPGRGSEFVIRLPALDEARPPDPAPAAVDRPGVDPSRVLLVDDNADAAAMLADALTANGFVVRVANDPLEALACLSSFQAEAVVLDIGLPVLDGYELAARIRRQHGPSLRLVALTGYGQSADRARSREAGFDAHLVKPVDLSELVEALHAGASPARDD